jgi:hypothetical protein
MSASAFHTKPESRSKAVPIIPISVLRMATSMFLTFLPEPVTAKHLSLPLVFSSLFYG